MATAATISQATNRDALESLEGFSKLPARVRESYQPLDLSTTAEVRNQRVSRAEKAGRRDSRLGLRNIFGRPKQMRHSDGPNPAAFAIPEVAENTTQGIPYYTLPPGKPIVWTEAASAQALPITPEEPEPELQLTRTTPPEVTRRKVSSTKTQGRPDAVSWDLPPMHKAYAQAVRYSTLSTATISADVILKNQDKKAAEASSAADGAAKSEDRSKSKKKHRRTKSTSEFEWTSKTYILVTPGCLLEYASEGPFDRLPEKALRLGEKSAAFASDLIPGRHWVLQVSSSIGSDGVASTDTGKSFLSRLPFRGHTEKRSAANLLLVFDNAELMNEWLVTLRGTVQALGGKQTLSETGKPVAEEENPAPLRGQASQRTLTRKEYDRYSRSTGDSQSWEQDFIRRKSDASHVQSESARNQSLDEMSTTNSFVSHDGRQLDSLRDSSNRLSCVSSGQRTMITSEDSSPACSPTAETFASISDDPPRRHQDAIGAVGADGRLRPNAGAIADRRKSLQTMSPFLEVRQNQSPPQRPQSTMIGAISSGSPVEMGMVSSPQPQPQPKLPNFSVPQSSNRRFSSLRTLQADAAPLQTPLRMDFHLPSRSGSKRPPTALRISRPLSMVTDQPSPMDSMPERPATRHGESSKLSEAAVETPPLPAARPITNRQTSDTSIYNGPRSPPQAPGTRVSPRRLSSMGALRQKSGELSPTPLGDLNEQLRWRPLHPPQVRAQDPERCYSSVDSYDHSKLSSSYGSRATKRSSMLPYVPDQQQYYQPPRAPPPSGPLPAVPAGAGNRASLKPEANSRSLLSRRSMPQLAEGPPPAPAPTCALPPIPQHLPNMI